MTRLMMVANIVGCLEFGSSESFCIFSIPAQYVVEGERIIKTMIAEIDRKMIEERRNADWYISDEAMN